MAINVKAELEALDKEVLVQTIMDMAEGGAISLERIYLRNDNPLSASDIKDSWQRLYNFAREKDSTDDYDAASTLADGASLCLEKAKLLKNEAEAFSVCEEIANDLHDAAEVDGIGMYGDHEWIYLDVAEEIEEFLGVEEE